MTGPSPRPHRGAVDHAVGGVRAVKRLATRSRRQLDAQADQFAGAGTSCT